MPSRILREGILTSPRMARLGWADEVFYRRLHSVVDDFGRYYADPGMLRAACYPRQLSKVSDSDIGKWLQCIADAGLVRVYPAEDGERYLEVLDFGQQVRAKKSKFPGMSSECLADAEQPASPREAPAPVFGDGDVVDKERAPRGSRLASPFVLDEAWREWARKERPDLDLDLTAATFADFWLAKPGKDGVKLDWEATWRNWVRKERMKPADVARVTVAAPSKPSSYLAEQEEHRKAVEADRIARKQRQTA